MGRYSSYGIGLTYTCKMEASNLVVIRKLLDIPNIQIYNNGTKYNNGTEYDTDEDVLVDTKKNTSFDIGTNVGRVMLDKKKVDTAINTPNVTNEMLYQCVLDGWDYLCYDNSDVHLIFYYEISSFDSHSAESNDFYKMNISPCELMSKITSCMEEMKQCGVEQIDIKCHHFGSEWC